MNCVELFTQKAKEHPERTAIWLSPTEQISFAELLHQGGKAQVTLRKMNLKAGDSLLLLETLTPQLYAIICAALGMGVSVILVEPWMPVTDIEHVINLVKPKLFVTRWWGYLWGLRVSSIRHIPRWMHVTNLFKESTSDFKAESVDPQIPGIITFTTGTTGKPKGVRRNQGYLVDQYHALDHSLGLSKHDGPDMTLFANFALANLAAGRTSVIVNPKWKKTQLEHIFALPKEQQPVTLTTGPAFLLELFKYQNILPELKSIHVGGALTDTWIFKEAFKRWPKSQFLHLYGSSEAEPVAHADAREAVSFSEGKGYFQTLFVGHPASEIQSKFEDTGLWVTGPHVCPEYIGNAEENKKNKHKDSEGHVWHSMGDRIVSDEKGWWYSGRSQQSLEDFELEQQVYAFLKSSKAFLHKSRTGLCLVGENLSGKELEIRKTFPVIQAVHEAKIIRDRRHRARIDRLQSLKKAGLHDL
ncbi:AMP-binding protein [Bdellovibrio sp. HCB-162]|uniref:AMP-binding protein n=1 Tax=Bdellovibrio sp. HCB-162 TaxID=3394234 RepID=UPI0039BC56FF